MNYFLLHLWELGGNYFDYFYFQENCSYHLLSLLEVADPNLQLTDHFLFHVIPADTIKVLTKYPELISDRVYRPSLLSQMNDKRLRMTQKQENLFYMLAEDPSSIEKTDYSNLSVPEKALVLDAYLDYAQYKTVQKEKTTTAIDKTTRKILLERSRLNYQSNDPHKAIQFSSPPELGHGSARIRLGFGSHDSELFQEISLRPGHHDLLAKDIGYSKDSQILFLDFTARYYNDKKEAKLDNLKIIDIISLTPYDPLFQKLSWKLSLGVDTIKDIECGLCNSYKANYGLGLAYKPSYFSPILFYALADIEAELSSYLDAYYRAGGGGTLGGLLDITENWRVQILGNVLKFPLGHQSHYYKASFNQRYAFTQNLDIRLELSKLKNKEEWLVSVNYYF